MCGIVGILSKHEVAPVILDALQRLEYRGYDSAGIATLDAGRIDRRRAQGKLINLSDLLVHSPSRAKPGLAIRDGQHTEARLSSMRTRITPDASQWCIMASSRTSVLCARS